MDLVEKLASEWEKSVRQYQYACMNLLALFTPAINDWVKTALARMPAEWRPSWDAFVQEWSEQGVELQEKWKQKFVAWMAEQERRASGVRNRTVSQQAAKSAQSKPEVAADVSAPYTYSRSRLLTPQEMIDESNWIRRVGPFAGLLHHLRSLPANVPLDPKEVERLLRDGSRIESIEERRLGLTGPEVQELDRYLRNVLRTRGDANWPPTVPESWRKKDLAEQRADEQSQFSPSISASGQGNEDPAAAHEKRLVNIDHDVWSRKPESRPRSTLKLTPEWDGDAYFWVFTDDQGKSFARVHIADYKDGSIHVLEEFGGYLLEKTWWSQSGERALNAEANGFSQHVLAELDGAITADELELLVSQYLRNGGRAPIKKAIREEQERRDRDGYVSAAPGSPEYTEWQRKLSAAETERFILFLMKQGYSRAFAKIAMFLLPASVNPNSINLDNVAMMLGTAGVAAKGAQRLRTWAGHGAFESAARRARVADPSTGSGFVPDQAPERSDPQRNKTYPVIEGVIDRPRTPEHRFLQEAIADEAQATGAYVRISRGSIKLSKFAGMKLRLDIKPDFMGLTGEGRIDMMEIVSPSQTITELLGKMKKAMKQLPQGMRGGMRAIDPQDAFK